MSKTSLYLIALTVLISPAVGRSGGPGATDISRADDIRIPESACAMPGDPSAGSRRIAVIPAFQAGSAGAGPERLFVPSKTAAAASQPGSQTKVKPLASRVAAAQSQPAQKSVLAQAGVGRVGRTAASTSQPDRPAGRSAAPIVDLPGMPGEVISSATTVRTAAVPSAVAAVSAGEFAPSQPADKLVARSPNYELSCRAEGNKSLFSLARGDKAVFASVSGDQLLTMLGGLDDEATELICSVKLSPAEKP